MATSYEIDRSRHEFFSFTFDEMVEQIIDLRGELEDEKSEVESLNREIELLNQQLQEAA